MVAGRIRQRRRVIASVAFQNFKALRNAQIALQPFNLVIGPNGSGKTSLIQSLLRLRTLAKLGPSPADVRARPSRRGSPEIVFRFSPPHEGLSARLRCVSDNVCDAIEIEPVDAPGWPALQASLGSIRSYLFDHYAMAGAVEETETLELAVNGANLSSVLAAMQRSHPENFAALGAELMRIMPEFSRLDFARPAARRVELALQLRTEESLVTTDNLSQGTLYLLAVLVLAFHPAPPTVVCIEEVDRGIHPRMLREVRDLLYRLSYPDAMGAGRAAVQVVATTHSPYLLDLFRDHPEEVVISQKQGSAAHFERLVDRPDLPALLAEGTLGDMWFSGILGGVPEE